MSDALIKLDKVTRVYKRGGETIHALDEFELEIPKGGFYALMGPSGSGKTTLLNMLGGLDLPDSGTVSIGGDDIGTMSGSDLAQWRADNVGFVFQGFNLLPVLTAIQNVELPLLLAPLSRKERRQHAEHALKLVGLADRANHKPRELSGGQEQRVAIARALATDPKLILADEPTGDLDRKTADQVLKLLRRLNEEFGKTIVMVTHDPLAAESARHVAHLDKGKLGKVIDNEELVPVGTAVEGPPAGEGEDEAKAEPSGDTDA